MYAQSPLGIQPYRHPRLLLAMPLRRPRLLIIIATLLFVALTVRLGYWQLGRGQHKQALAERQQAMDQLALLPWRGELGEAAWQRRYQVEGVWLASGQIFLDNRIHKGRAGFHVLAPLQLADGRLLLVNRGWLPKVPGVQPQAPLPAGPVVLQIRLQPPQQQYVELAADQAGGVVWQNLDWARYRKLVPASVVPALAQQLGESDTLARDWPAVDFGVEKHYAYAGQWFLFAALAVVLFFILHWKRRNT